MVATLTFLGAAGTVTGSKFLLDNDHRRTNSPSVAPPSCSPATSAGPGTRCSWPGKPQGIHRLAAHVILTGYQAVGTRGRQLAEGATELTMFGRYVPVRAETGWCTVVPDLGEGVLLG
jgi:hypothetical protein